MSNLEPCPSLCVVLTVSFVSQLPTYPPMAGHGFSALSWNMCSLFTFPSTPTSECTGIHSWGCLHGLSSQHAPCCRHFSVSSHIFWHCYWNQYIYQISLGWGASYSEKRRLHEEEFREQGGLRNRELEMEGQGQKGQKDILHVTVRSHMKLFIFLHYSNDSHRNH